jgi:lipopolysaccharide assembly outer membrane protein LptD (OstA)
MLTTYALIVLFIFFHCPYAYAQEEKKPIVVNGDNVEYFTETKQVTAEGNIVINYSGAKLTCDKITVNTETKAGLAEGNVRIIDERGVIEGEKVTYNFETKTGVIFGANFMSQPYFGKAKKVEKLNDVEFLAHDAYATTCNYNHPHFRFQADKLDFFRGDKIQSEKSIVYLGPVPILYLPRFSRSLKDQQSHIQVSPGKSSDWGPYLLTATRFNLAQNLSARIYLDYRAKLGVAEGFGANYRSKSFGRGDFKYYYTQERTKAEDTDTPGEFQRYLIRWRHSWEIGPRTNLISEYYKIVDAKRMVLGTEYNILKDYFYREYEKDARPLSYTLLHHYFPYSSLDLLIQKRTNRWYEQLEKLPELKYSLPSIRVGASPLYFESILQAANFNYKYPVPSPSSSDISVNRLDASNKVSLPFRLGFINLKPFVANRSTYYSSELDDSSVSPRTIFYTGADASTKFYRVFALKSGFLGMAIDGLRHVITPSVSYAYNHFPTVPSNRLKQIDAIDSIGSSNALSFQLSNKLQTKRQGMSVDLANLRLESSYNFYNVDPMTYEKNKDNFTDFLVDLELFPYAWLRLDSDAVYRPSEKYFTEANYGVNLILGQERSVGIGQRYQRKGSNEITSNFRWRFNPKWKFSCYQRYALRGNSSLSLLKGMQEQEYSVARDLHCWIMEVAFNHKKEEGSTLWFIFRLKAFPELEFDFSQSYHGPKSGSQSNQ